MSVADLVLQFVYDDETGLKLFYLPGDMLRGTIQLQLKRSLRVRNMTLLILGGAAVSWEEPGKDKLYTAREEYLQGSKLLLDSGEEDSLVFDKGVHCFSFTYQLPDYLPSSFSGTYGSINYLAKVLVTPEDDALVSLTSEPFLVLRRPLLSPDAFTPTELKTSKTFYTFCANGKIKMQCRISRTAAVPGDLIYVDAEVTNWSQVGIVLLQASIFMLSTYRAQNSDREIRFRHTLNKRIDVFDVPNCRGRRWRNVQMAVPPYLPDSGLEGCAVMDVSYLFEYRAQLEGRKDILVEFPLYVGGTPEGFDQPSPYYGKGRLALDGYGHAYNSHAYNSYGNNDLAWYGDENMTDMESVDGDLFAIK